MANGLRILPEVLRSFNSSTLTGSFQAIGVPVLYAACLVKFVNTSSSLITVSWDGVNPHDVLPGTSISLYDICSDAGSQRGLYVAQGTQFWVSGIAGVGMFYLVVFHTSEY